MITEMVTKEQLSAWKRLYAQHRPTLKPDRISGAALDDWFRAAFHPELLENPAFREVVLANAAVQAERRDAPEVAAYLLDGDVLVGIDRTSGFFHVECENIPKAVPVWDALFLHRGLSAQDLGNYVITGQYLELLGKQGGEV